MVFNKNLPRLSKEWYKGHAWVFWTHTFKNRATGWLTYELHLKFRELLLHVLIRERLICPVYVLMPDHMHLLWIGWDDMSCQLAATRKLRYEINKLLPYHPLQEQAHDHVLREYEKAKNAFSSTWFYVVNNPVRAGLVEAWQLYPYLGCMVPGIASLSLHEEDFLERFWRAAAYIQQKW